MNIIINSTRLILLCLVLCTSTVFGQFQPSSSQSGALYYNSGNVGIGTSNPDEKLEVKGRIKVEGNYGMIFNASASDPYVGISFKKGEDLKWLLDFGTNQTYNLRFMKFDGSSGSTFLNFDYANNEVEIPNFDLGIGTSAPQSKVHIRSNNYQDFIILDRTGRTEIDNLFYITPSWDSDQNDQLRILAGNTNIAAFEETGMVGIGTLNPKSKLTVTDASINQFELENSSGNSWQFRAGNSGSLIIKDDGVEQIRINAAGSVQIGQISAPSGYKLAVDGKVIMEEVKVALSTSWPDYVFAEHYELTPLAQIKSYVAKNHHLPDVPSAEQVAEEGINLGEMNSILLKKIEELTLHMIAKDEREKELWKKLEKQQEEINSLKSKIN